MASTSEPGSSKSSNGEEKEKDERMFECNICLDTAKDAVVSMCGHLFCWPCLHQWLETRPTRQVCPVCKAAIGKDKVVPLYGRGSGKQEDPRNKVPPRPQGQRTEPENNSGFPGFGFGDGGFHMSFGIGAFPFGFFTSTFNFGEPRPGAGRTMKRVNCRSITSYFSPASKRPTLTENNAKCESFTTDESGCSTSIAAQNKIIKDDDSHCSASNKLEKNNSVSSEFNSASAINQDQTADTKYENDIGLYIGQNIDDFLKNKLLNNPWSPPKTYDFPHSVHNKNGKEVKRHLNQNHLDRHSWLVLSHVHGGLYCKYCVLFSVNQKGGHNRGIDLQKFVTKPLKKFSKLYGKDGDITTHEQTKYHKSCVAAAIDFVMTYNSPEMEITNQINVQRLKQVTENRQRLYPIVKTIIFLGRQNIPLRGHRDDGSLLDDCRNDTRSDKNGSVTNEGNFREILKYRIDAGDHILESHLTSSSSRATYISKTTQDAIIKACEEEVTSVILEKVKKSTFFAVIFDETTDNSCTEQLSISLRYVYENVVCEDFLLFVDAYTAVYDTETVISDHEDDEDEDTDSDIILNNSEPRLTGKALGSIVVDVLQNKLHLDMHNCVGIGTDGCSTMSSELVGAVAEILKVAPNASHCSCMNHALNLVLLKSSDVTCIRNAVGVIKSVISFFHKSAKRTLILKKLLGKQLKGLCETRWIERHDAIICFRDAFPKIVRALEKISHWQDSATSSKASTFLNSLCNSEFVISLISLINILKVTLPVSRLLQTKSLDVHSASETITDTTSIFSCMRKNYESEFHTIYTDAEKLAFDLGFEIRKPRITMNQTRRENHPSECTEDYYRRSLYVPLLDNVLNDLQRRFSKQSLKILDLRLLMPQTVIKETLNEESTKSALNYLASGFSTFSNKNMPMLGTCLWGEYILWKTMWQRRNNDKDKIPQSVLEVLHTCDEITFPLIRTLLTILCTLPVSNATAERSFSTLRRVKSWLRTRISEERLNGLCLLHVHRHLVLNTDRIIDRFAKKNKNRLDFVL